MLQNHEILIEIYVKLSYFIKGISKLILKKLWWCKGATLQIEKYF